MQIQELFGIQWPVIQAPMAGSQGSVLAIAVAEAGGLGSLPCAMLSEEALRKELTTIRAQTRKPFNVNFFCHVPPEPDAAREAAWLALLAPYFDELGVDAAAIPAAPARAPFTAAIADLVEEFAPPVVSFHFGLPSVELLARVRSWGSTILSSATTLEEARWLESRGVDAIIAQGVEAGGHRGIFLNDDLNSQSTTLDLVRGIVSAVALPVIAAGGIAGPQDVALAMRAGAAGVQVGTSYLLCPEATTSKVHRAALKSDAAQHTALTNVFTGRPARGIVNRLMRELGPMNAAAPAFPLAGTAVAALRARAEAHGSKDFSPLWAGKKARAVREVSAAVLTQELAAGVSCFLETFGDRRLPFYERVGFKRIAAHVESTTGGRYHILRTVG